MSALIRVASASDEAAVIALWKECELTRPWNDPQADFRRACGSMSSAILLAELDGIAAGTVMTGFDGHRGWIYYLCTQPKLRHSGLGRRLLDAAADWLAARNCPKVELMVREGNPAAAVYEHLGWELQDVRVYARWLNRKDK